MQDSFGHLISYLRVSITDRCNERCLYCMPQEEQTWTPREDVLTDDEILRVVRIGVSLGLRKLRVTGGEPLTRPGVLGLMRRLGALAEITDLGLSTNGSLLARLVSEADGGGTMAHALRRLGVRTVNISLDTLDPARYALVTGRALLPQTLDGIAAAVAAGFHSVKLNCVLMRHRNEADLPALVRFAGERGLLLRFIELMPVSTTDVLTEENFLPVATARRLIEEHFGPLQPDPDFRTNGPAVYFRLPGSGQRVGFIGALTSPHFCADCNKLRLTCEGQLRPCLGSHLEFDLRHPLRHGATDDDLRRVFLETVARKPEKHDFLHSYQPRRQMVAIGG